MLHGAFIRIIPLVFLLGALAGCGSAAEDASDSNKNKTVTQQVEILENATYGINLTKFGNSFQIVSGADAALFDIKEATTLSFISPADYENPQDSSGKNRYQVTLAVDKDSDNYHDLELTVLVVNANDNAPTIGGPDNYPVEENNLHITKLPISDSDGDKVAVSISGGADSGKISVDSEGNLRFTTAPDYEIPGDADGDRTYEVELSVYDGLFTTEKTLRLNVVNVNDITPVLTNGPEFTVPENNLAIATLSATDTEGDGISFSMGGGDDSQLFQLASNGTLSFKVPANFEKPADKNTDNSYQLTVIVSDGIHLEPFPIKVTVTDANDAPTLVSAEFHVDENTIQTGTAVGSDEDPGTTLQYTLRSGGDGALFNLSSGGLLSFKSAPDYEQPTDTNKDNRYEITIVVSDGQTSTESPVSVIVGNVNDIAPIIQSTGTHTIEENTTAIFTLQASDADGDSLAYSAPSGADAVLFSVSSDGQVTFKTAPDYDLPADNGGNNVYNVNIAVTDGKHQTLLPVVVNVTNVNDIEPTLLFAADYSVVENNAQTLTLSASDPEGDQLTFSLTASADSGLFALNGNQLSFISQPDFEAPLDSDTNNIYQLNVAVSDGVHDVNRDFTVSVKNANDILPVFDATGPFSAAENQIQVGTVSASDQDKDLLSFSLPAKADNALFQIGNDGVLTFSSPPNYESPADNNKDNAYDVIVNVNDGLHNVEVSVQVTVTNVNDAPVIAAVTQSSMAENGLAAATLTASDEDKNSLTFSLAGGPDQALFNVAANGAVTFKTAPNYEIPTDSNTNNVYDITVRVSDGLLSADGQLQVTVTNINDLPPIYTGQVIFSNAENSKGLFQLSGTDPDGDNVGFRLAQGGDEALFSIDANNNLSFNATPDYEAPTDANKDNHYQVEIELYDGVFTSVETLDIAVTNINDNAPHFTSVAQFQLNENTTQVGTITTTDADRDTVTVSILPGGNSGLFRLESGGNLRFVNAPDFETPAGTGGNTYSITLQASDATFTSQQTLAVTVTNVNDNPPQLSGSGNFTVNENSTAVATLVGSDVDGDSVSFSLLSGQDSARFNLSNGGVLSFIQAPDFEAPTSSSGGNLYKVPVRVNDSIFNSDYVLSVDVKNINDLPPKFTLPPMVTINENTVLVASGLTSDPDFDPVTVTIVNTGDAAQFSVVGQTLRFNFQPNFEQPVDLGTNNSYDITLRADDGLHQVTQAISINVLNVLDPPVVSATYDIKQIHLTWSEEDVVDSFKVYEHQGFMTGELLLAGLGGTTFLHDTEVNSLIMDWPSAYYVVESCQGTNCVRSDPYYPQQELLGTIAFGKMPSPLTGANLGYQVRTNFDGRIVAASSDRGVHIYERGISGQWNLLQVLSGDSRSPMALNLSGNEIAIRDNASGDVEVFDTRNGNRIALRVAASPTYGDSLALSDNGILVIGDPSRDRVLIRDGFGNVPGPTINGIGPEFGSAVAITPSGDRLFVSSIVRDRVHIHERPASWSEIGLIEGRALPIPAPQDFGKSLATNFDGTSLLVGSRDGAHLLSVPFFNPGTNSQLEFSLQTPPFDPQTVSFSLDPTGMKIAIGVQISGPFDPNGGVFPPVYPPLGGPDGAVLVYERGFGNGPRLPVEQFNNGQWQYRALVFPPYFDPSEAFGFATALSGDGRSLIVGDPMNDRGQSGITVKKPSAPADPPPKSNSGAFYIY